jgi:hypothetical protein
MSGVSAVNPFVAFYDVHEKERLVRVCNVKYVLDCVNRCDG